MTVDAGTARPVQFSISRAITDSVRILLRNLLLFAVLAIVIRMIWWLAPPRAVTSAAGPIFGLEWSRDFARPLVGLAVSGLTEAAIVVGALRSLQGRRASFRDVIQGLSFLLPIALGTAILWVIGMAPQLVGSVLEQLLGGSQSTAGPIVAGLAGFVLFIPTIIITLACSVFAPAIVAEKVGVIEALIRSFQLTKGRRWALVGLFVIVMVAFAVVVIVASQIAGVSSWEIASPTSFTTAAMVGHVLMSLIGAFAAVQLTVVYAHLRAEKEGLGVEEIVQIFD